MTEAHPATTGQPIDLDRVEAQNERTVAMLEEAVQRVRHNPIAGPVVGLLMGARIDLADVPRLVAEVRAAREARRSFIELHDDDDLSEGHEYRLGIYRILAVWDQATGGIVR